MESPKAVKNHVGVSAEKDYLCVSENRNSFVQKSRTKFYSCSQGQFKNGNEIPRIERLVHFKDNLG